MILLDTNVISALMQHKADPVVVAWLDSQVPEAVWTTAITVFEIRLGLERLPLGRKRRELDESFRKMLDEDLKDRIIPFDQTAAWAAGRIAAERSRIGRSVDFRDVQIAGIGTVRKAVVATRNIRHFEGLGLPLINPWSALTSEHR